MANRTSVNHYESLKASGDYRSINNMAGWTGGTIGPVWDPASTKKVRVRRVHLSVVIAVAPAAGEGNFFFLREETSGDVLCAILAIPDTAVIGDNFSASIDLGEGAINTTAGKDIMLQTVSTTVSTVRYIFTIVIQGDEE